MDPKPLTLSHQNYTALLRHSNHSVVELTDQTSIIRPLMSEPNYEPLRNYEAVEEQPQDLVPGGRNRTTRIASIDVFRGLAIFVKLSLSF
ncbi:hypothetical protein RHSIM_Rhsim11G0192500 [Rhododendron simsii]|uniref:Uncharacterized protein n=1 Tax=Rhododendron simsii TaxID=118357 RepID=A0A834G8I2_RHOSS|nr:hypothetical protein RHSIM_Rhsim11G0192500 [Rhododendron simsii]